MNSIYYSTIDSPVGPLLLIGNGDALTHLHMSQQRHASELSPTAIRDDAMLQKAREQLTAYFAGELQRFELSLAPEGTEFQQKVWNALLDIPFGTTESYGELAKRIGNANASRAVGLANGHNPIGIVIPCHRVIGANGSLTGYGGGIERKQWLLEHEQRFGTQSTPRQTQLKW